MVLWLLSISLTANSTLRTMEKVTSPQNSLKMAKVMTLWNLKEEASRSTLMNLSAGYSPKPWAT